MPSVHSRPGRVCPGRYMADATVWASIASLLSVFDFKKARDAEGKEINITPMFSDGGVRQATRICNFAWPSHVAQHSIPSHPLPFDCSITVRSEAARKLIMG